MYMRRRYFLHMCCLLPHICQLTPFCHFFGHISGSIIIFCILEHNNTHIHTCIQLVFRWQRSLAAIWCLLIGVNVFYVHIYCIYIVMYISSLTSFYFYLCFYLCVPLLCCFNEAFLHFILFAHFNYYYYYPYDILSTFICMSCTMNTYTSMCINVLAFI